MSVTPESKSRSPSVETENRASDGAGEGRASVSDQTFRRVTRRGISGFLLSPTDGYATPAAFHSMGLSESSYLNAGISVART